MVKIDDLAKIVIEGQKEAALRISEINTELAVVHGKLDRHMDREEAIHAALMALAAKKEASDIAMAGRITELEHFKIKAVTAIGVVSSGLFAGLLDPVRNWFRGM